MYSVEEILSVNNAGPKIISDAAQNAFEQKAISIGIDPSDLWVGGYVDYEWGRLKHILDAYRINPHGGCVLEFGTNVGASAIVYSYLGAKVSAVDICDDFVSLAKLNAQRYGENSIDYIHISDTRSLPFDDCSFDLVNCNSVLEYVEDKYLKAVQSEIDRVLKSNGKILITGTSSRLWPKEVHSQRWLVNFFPKSLDRFLGAPNGYQRGVSPWRVRYGFGSNYKNLDVEDKGESYLQSRLMISPSQAFYYRVLVRFARIFGVGPGLFTSNISCLLQKQ